VKSSIFISIDGMTDPLGQSQVLPYLCGLSAKGYQIFLISCEKPDRYQKGKVLIEDICSNNNIQWHPILYWHKPPVISPFLNVLRLNSLAKRLINNNHIDLLHCRSYLSALIGLGFKLKHGKKFLFDMRGFYPNERVDGNIWPQTNYVYRAIYQFFKRKEVDFCENADYTISLTFNGKQEIHSWKNISNNPIPIEVIPCCADLDFFSSKNVDNSMVEALKLKLNISDSDYVLTYLGAIGTWYMTDEMLGFFKQLQEQKSNAIFLIITAEDPELVRHSASQVGIDASRIRVFKASRKEVVQLLSITNFSIFFIKPAYSKKASSPTKLGELLSMGIPVICNANVGDVDHIITKSNTGIVIKSFNKENYLDAIDRMAEYEVVDIAKRAESVKEFFDLKTGVERYASVYHKLLG
jgi:glycosyltransferase involved in cell wall biosynthesis